MLWPSVHTSTTVNVSGGRHLSRIQPALDVDDVDAEQARLTDGGVAGARGARGTCCYAAQDNFWVEGAPDGERWEVYTVLADGETFFASPAGRGA